MTDLDPLLHDAMSRVRGPVDARPSLTDVRRRARRHNRRRMTATVGVVACTGVATAALIVRRDSTGNSGVASAPAGTVADGDGTSTVYLPALGPTTTVFGLPALTITASAVWDALWNARYDPSGAGLVVEPADQAAADVMPTPEQFGCTSPECRAMYNYVVWHEIAVQLGFSSVRQMQDVNPSLDLSQPPREGDVVQSIFGDAATPPTMDPNNETPTTISVFDGVVLIDGGAPAGAMEDAYQRLPGYNRVIVPSSGKTVEQTMVMPIGDNGALASAVGGVFGIDGFDTWDPSYIGSQIEGMVAVVIGPDYWDLVGGIPQGAATVSPTTSSTIVG
jgi:hypothetical protein